MSDILLCFNKKVNLLTQTGNFKVRYRQEQRRSTMTKQTGKKIALFLLLILAYIGSFGFELLPIKKFPFDWASILGICVAIGWSVNSRLLKWTETPDFRGEKFVWPFVITLAIYIPIIMFVVLPELGQPRGDWGVDAFIAFLTSCFFFTNMSTTALTKTWERVKKKLSKPTDTSG